VYLAQIQDCFSRQDFDAALKLSYQLRNKGESEHDGRALLYGYVYIAQCYGGINMVDSMSLYFGKALPMAEREKDYWALATIYNSLGGNTAFGEGDYSQGIAYLIEALRYAENIRDTSRLMLVKNNLAMAYCFINDSTGLIYAQDVYRNGVDNNNIYRIFQGAMISANLYWMMRDTANALRYVKEALPYVEMYDQSREVYVLYADILRDIGKKDSSVIYYRKAFQEQSGSGIYSKADLYLGYAEFLKEDRRYDDAVRVLMDGLHMMDSVRSPAKKPMMYLSLSGIYEDMGELGTALTYYKQYNEEANRQLNLEIERKISSIRREYDKQKHEVELLEWRNKYNLAVMAFVFAVCVFVGLYLLYRSKVKNYRQLLKQHQTILERQETRPAQTAAVPMPQDKMKEMYDRLEKLMYEQELYRQSDLSRDKVAQMLSTNRTYLCSVIKSFTGMTFPYYVNSFRINEAVGILSDPEDDTPIKAIAAGLGYNNLTTFYRLFEAAKGMPPSKYRETVIQNANLADCKK
jgi:AraC-like DNA-binding protein/Tfp pilus assembly protein PilF